MDTACAYKLLRTFLRMQDTQSKWTEEGEGEKSIAGQVHTGVDRHMTERQQTATALGMAERNSLRAANSSKAFPDQDKHRVESYKPAHPNLKQARALTHC